MEGQTGVGPVELAWAYCPCGLIVILLQTITQSLPPEESPFRMKPHCLLCRCMKPLSGFTVCSVCETVSVSGERLRPDRLHSDGMT